MEPTEICILCKQTLLGGQTVKVQKGIDNLKRMSVIRNDDVHKLLQNKDSIEIHTKCRLDILIYDVSKKRSKSRQKNRDMICEHLICLLTLKQCVCFVAKLQIINIRSETLFLMLQL